MNASSAADTPSAGGSPAGGISIGGKPTPTATGGPGTNDNAGWHLSARRAAALTLLPALVLIAVGPVPLLLWRDRLPDPLATHWGFSGGPNGATGYAALLAVTIGAVVLSTAAVGWVVLNRRRRDPYVYPFVVFLALMLAGIACGSSATIVAVNLDVTDWHRTGPLSGWLVAAAVAGSVALAAAVTRALPAPPPRPAAADGTPHATPRPLAPGERAVWVGTLTNRWLLVPSAVLCVVGLVWVVVGPGRWVGLSFVPLGLATSALATVRVTVDRRGLQVAYGPLHWPRTRLPVERIESADVIEVHPTEWGGWGYRGSIKLMKRAAVVLRRGPGLHLRLRDGSEFAVTVDHPEPGADLLNRLLVAAGPAPR